MRELEQAGRVVIVAAHPDDEVIGAGGLLRHLRRVTIIHTTDGSPVDQVDARRNGFHSREDYARARREELYAALDLAGVPRENTVGLGFTDQQTMLYLREICERLAAQIAALRPDAVVTHPYEGGHPDHDSTAFATHRVCRGLGIPLFEMTSYHAENGAENGALEAGVFLANGDGCYTRELSEGDRARKERMLACFRTQSAVLSAFSAVGPERFRPAPRYDFSEPPHPGRLYYELMPWGVSGAQWRACARCL